MGCRREGGVDSEVVSMGWIGDARMVSAVVGR